MTKGKESSATQQKANVGQTPSDPKDGKKKEEKRRLDEVTGEKNISPAKREKVEGAMSTVGDTEEEAKKEKQARILDMYSMLEGREEDHVAHKRRIPMAEDEMRDQVVKVLQWVVEGKDEVDLGNEQTPRIEVIVNEGASEIIMDNFTLMKIAPNTIIIKIAPFKGKRLAWVNTAIACYNFPFFLRAGYQLKVGDQAPVADIHKVAAYWVSSEMWLDLNHEWTVYNVDGVFQRSVSQEEAEKVIKGVVKLGDHIQQSGGMTVNGVVDSKLTRKIGWNRGEVTESQVADKVVHKTVGRESEERQVDDKEERKRAKGMGERRMDGREANKKGWDVMEERNSNNLVTNRSIEKYEDKESDKRNTASKEITTKTDKKDTSRDNNKERRSTEKETEESATKKDGERGSTSNTVDKTYTPKSGDKVVYIPRGVQAKAWIQFATIVIEAGDKDIALPRDADAACDIVKKFLEKTFPDKKFMLQPISMLREGEEGEGREGERKAANEDIQKISSSISKELQLKIEKNRREAEERRKRSKLVFTPCKYEIVPLSDKAPDFLKARMLPQNNESSKGKNNSVNQSNEGKNKINSEKKGGDSNIGRNLLIRNGGKKVENEKVGQTREDNYRGASSRIGNSDEKVGDKRKVTTLAKQEGEAEKEVKVKKVDGTNKELEVTHEGIDKETLKWLLENDDWEPFEMDINILPPYPNPSPNDEYQEFPAVDWSKAVLVPESEEDEVEVVVKRGNNRTVSTQMRRESGKEEGAKRGKNSELRISQENTTEASRKNIEKEKKTTNTQKEEEEKGTSNASKSTHKDKSTTSDHSDTMNIDSEKEEKMDAVIEEWEDWTGMAKHKEDTTNRKRESTTTTTTQQRGKEDQGSTEVDSYQDSYPEDSKGRSSHKEDKERLEDQSSSSPNSPVSPGKGKRGHGEDKRKVVPRITRSAKKGRVEEEEKEREEKRKEKEKEKDKKR